MQHRDQGTLHQETCALNPLTPYEIKGKTNAQMRLSTNQKVCVTVV